MACICYITVKTWAFTAKLKISVVHCTFLAHIGSWCYCTVCNRTIIYKQVVSVFMRQCLLFCSLVTLVIVLSWYTMILVDACFLAEK